MIDYDHGQRELLLREIWHVLIPEVFPKVVPLATLDDGLVGCQTAASVDVVTNAAQSMCLPPSVHLRSLLHHTGVDVESECLL